MTELSGKTEKIEPYRFFGVGEPRGLMAEVKEAGYVPAGISTILHRRMYAPEDVRSSWQNEFFWTGDSSATDRSGCAVITLDAPFLRDLTSETFLRDHALPIDGAALWEEIKNAPDALYLSAEQVKQANGKGYVLKEGVWQPENDVVRMVWEGTDKFPGLSRGLATEKLQKYAHMTSSASNSEHIMQVYFDRSQPEKPQARSWVVFRLYNYSIVYGNNILDFDNGRVAGEAPEARSLEQAAEGGRAQSTQDDSLLAVVREVAPDYLGGKSLDEFLARLAQRR
jgi:hypothetical protein